MALPLFVVSVLYGWASGSWVVAALFGCGFLASPWLPRLEAPKPVEHGAAVVAALVGASFGALSLPFWVHVPRLLFRGASSVAAAALSVALTRMVTRTPTGGYAVTVALGLSAMGACGATQVGMAYVFATLVFLLVAFGMMHRSAVGFVPLRAPRAFWMRLSLSALATTLGLLVLLPKLHARAEESLIRALEPPRVGFSERSLSLGALSGLSDVEDEVLTVEGEEVDYLRGAVYDRYEGGMWRAKPKSTTLAHAIPMGPGAIRVRLVGSERGRYFLPLVAGGFGNPSGAAVVDRFGIVLPVGEAKADNVYWFAPGLGSAPSPPSPEDGEVPASVEASLRSFAEAARGGKWGKEGLLEVAHTLRTRYGYSLEFSRGTGDPLVSFLEEDKRGHCEYFASALALSGRVLGIPTRVVAGYRVFEKNPFLGYFIVRQKNAHAWVEAWFEGEGWTRLDATPLVERRHAERSASALFAALTFLVQKAFWLVWHWVTELSLVGLLSLLSLVLLFSMLLRRIRKRNPERKEVRPELDEIPPAARSLFQALAAGFAPRPASETLESYARALEKGGRHDDARLVHRYAACRYGGGERIEEVLREMSKRAEALRS